MSPFDSNIVNTLNACISQNDEFVESILLSSYGFAISFVNFKIHCYDKVFATISGTAYEWDDAPNSGPWGSFGRQKAVGASLTSPTLLKIAFGSGDSISIQTSLGQYESVVFNFPSIDDKIVMETF
jgi:hypothetical protein